MPTTTEQSTITYTWAYPSLEVEFVNEEGLEKVVRAVHWTLTAIDGNVNAYTFGVVGLASPQPDTFLEYDELTPEIVGGWVHEALGGEEKVQLMYDNLAAQIADKKAPKSGSMPPPWNLADKPPTPTAV